MIEQLKQKPRIRTAYFDIKISDVVNLDFKKLIYVDGVYWRLNKIIDFKPHNNITTQVELIEWIEVGIFTALDPPTLAGGEYGGNPDPFEPV